MGRGSLVLALLAMACSRANPAFDDGGDPAGTTDKDTVPDRTTGPDDGVSTTVADATGTSTPGSSGSEPGTTSKGDTTTGDEGSTSIAVGSTGDCSELVTVMMEPSHDAFVESSPVLCGALMCASLNRGGSPQGLIEDLGAETRRYLILSFDLTDMVLPQPPLTTALRLTVGHPGEISLQAQLVRPIAWTEGQGLGTPAMPGESSWLWSASPAPWSTPAGMGTFEVVLEGAAELGDLNVAAAVGSHPVDIPLDQTALDDLLAGSATLHLVVTKVSGNGEAIAFTRESKAAPMLLISGC